MFRFTNIFVDDKKLPDFLHAMAGKIVSMDPPQPVVNASVGTDGKLNADTYGGTMSDMFIAHCRKNKIPSVTPSDVRAFLESVGRSPASCQHVLKQAVERGALRKKGKGLKARYEVVPATGAK